MVKADKVKTYLKNQVLYVQLNKPKQGNCLDSEMAEDLAKIFSEAGRKSSIRIIYIYGNGDNFCTGADLNWMLNAKLLTASQNMKDMSALTKMYQTMLNLKKVIIAKAHGQTLGGGLGLLAASDIVVCEKNSSFCLAEARLGLIPGIITPLLIRKIGYGRFCEYALTARTVTAKEALNDKLVNFLVDAQDVENVVEKLAFQIKQNSQGALEKIKDLSSGQLPITGKELVFFTKESAAMRRSPDFQKRAEKLINRTR